MAEKDPQPRLSILEGLRRLAAFETANSRVRAYTRGRAQETASLPDICEHGEAPSKQCHEEST